MAEFEEIEFRSLVANVCDRLSTHDLKRIVYVQLHQRRYQLEDAQANGFDIFDALECQGVFSPTAPEGLLGVVEKTQNKEVANIIEDYIEKRRKRESEKRVESPQIRNPNPPPLAQDAHLRACYEVARQQTKLVLKQMEVLKQAVWAGDQDEDGKHRGDQAIENVSKIASELAERLRSARRKVGIPRSLSGSSTDSCGSESDATAACAHRLHPSPAPREVRAKTPPPVKPRSKATLKAVHQESSCQENSRSSFVVISRTGSCPGLPQAHTSRPTSCVQPRPTKCPVPLPRRRNQGVLKSETPESPAEENEYHMLEAFLGPEGTGDSGIGASGTSSGDGEFTDVKKYAKEPIQTERAGDEVKQRYTTLNRNTMDERLEYMSLRRQEMAMNKTVHTTQ
jgi:hypothetical protein